MIISLFLRICKVSFSSPFKAKHSGTFPTVSSRITGYKIEKKMLDDKLFLVETEGKWDNIGIDMNRKRLLLTVQPIVS